MTEAARRPTRPRRSAAARRLLRLSAAIAGLIAAYYLVPVFEVTSGAMLAVRAVATALVLSVSLWLVVRTVVHELRAADVDVHLDHLVLAAVAGVVCFALADLAVARLGDQQFVGLETKTDALYFAMTTLTTVGFGDISAQGQLARQLVLVQLLFNIVVIATAARTMSRALSHRSHARRDVPRSEAEREPDQQAADQPWR
jgi:voltage-gated potassium channel